MHQKDFTMRYGRTIIPFLDSKNQVLPQRLKQQKQIYIELNACKIIGIDFKDNTAIMVLTFLTSLHLSSESRSISQTPTMVRSK